MGSRGAITLSIPPVRLSISFCDPVLPRRALLQPSASLSLADARAALSRSLFPGRAVSLYKRVQRPRPVFLRRPVPLILILLHIAGQIGGKCA